MVKIDRVPITGLRKPIIIECKGNYLSPENLSIEELLVRFLPLMKSIYRYFSSYACVFTQSSDYEDLYAQIQFEFCRLCREYDPNRGVDFLGYIKLHLQNRVYHYVTKQQRHLNKELLIKSFSGDSENKPMELESFLNLVDMESIKEFERAEAIASLDWNAIIGKKHKQLIQGVLFEKKSLEELAEREGVPVKILRLRLYFACNKLIDYANKKKLECEGE